MDVPSRIRLIALCALGMGLLGACGGEVSSSASPAGAGSGGMAGSGAPGGGGAGAGGGDSGTAGTGGVGTGGTGAGGVGASGAGGTAGADAGQGGGGGENCTNGIDDNGNGKIDCADPACQTAGYVCAPAMPGWKGPVAIWSGPTGSEPACKGGYPSVEASGNSGLEPGTVTCQSCSCGTPAGGTCSNVHITYWDTTSCTNGCWGCAGPAFTLADGASCTVFKQTHGPSGQSPSAARFSPPTASGSSCAPQADNSGKKIPPPTWASAMVACGGEATGGKGCGDATTECVPRPPSPFNSICIYQSGDKPCPAGAYTKKSVYYTGYADARSCTSCTCGAATGQSCSGSVHVYTDQCASDETVMTVPKKCYPVPADSTTAPYDGGLEDTRGATYTAGTPSGGSCKPGGGQPSGSVTGTGAVTFCCL